MRCDHRGTTGQCFFCGNDPHNRRHCIHCKGTGREMYGAEAPIGLVWLVRGRCSPQLVCGRRNGNVQLLDLPRLEADYVQKVLRRGQPHVRAVPGQPIHQDLPAVYRDLVRRSVVLRNEQQ